MLTSFSLSIINQSLRIYQEPVSQQDMGAINIEDRGFFFEELIVGGNHQYIK